MISIYIIVFIFCHSSEALQISATCDNQMYFYVDGTEYSSPNKNDWTKVDVLNVPSNGDVFGIKCVNSGGPGALIMSTSDGRVSNTVDWKCTNQLHTSWNTRGFDDSDWQTPVSFGKIGAQIWSVVTGINSEAEWIWTSGGTVNQPTDTTVYCRTNIKVHGAWSLWTSWSTCSKSCENGTQSRTRSCSDPAPAYNGDNCTGSSGSPETQECNTHNCPIHGGWSDFGSYSNCSCPSGTYSGSQERARACTNPQPQYNGSQCSGNTTETRSCNCPRDGGWTDWSEWNNCTVSCAGGSKNRTRSCTNPSPMYNGTECSGDTSETTSCNTHNCPIHGGWSSWTQSGSCVCPNGSVDGKQTYNRTCSNPEPQYNGNDCENTTYGETKKEDCNCPLDGGWSTWSDYDNCTAACGPGSKTRYRTCSNPTPAYGGANCTGNDSNSAPCEIKKCPIDGGWSDWSDYGECVCPSGSTNGTATSNRTCTNPTPQYEGQPCNTTGLGNNRTQSCICAIANTAGSQAATPNQGTSVAGAIAGALGAVAAVAVIAAVTGIGLKKFIAGKKRDDDDDEDDNLNADNAALHNGPAPCSTMMPDVV